MRKCVYPKHLQTNKKTSLMPLKGCGYVSQGVKNPTWKKPEEKEWMRKSTTK